MPIWDSLKKSKFLSIESKSFWKSIKDRNVLNPKAFLFLRIEHKTKIWSMHDLEALKPFCSSTKMLFFSKNVCRRLFRILEYNLETQHIKVIQRFCNGSRGSFSFFGIGFIWLESQSDGLIPEVKQSWTNLWNKIFAFCF